MAERGFKIVFGGTDNHMFLVDLSDRPYSGREACQALSLAHITVNKNAIPNDRRKPSEASGIRLGSPAMSTRGMGEPEARVLAGWIADILSAAEPVEEARKTKPRVLDLCGRFPIPR
jgi:glycine hydroxymethyltransferase